MKRIPLYLTTLVAGSVFYACQPASFDAATPASKAIPTEVTAKVRAMGFSTYNMQRTEGGYVVENDIFLGENDFEAGRQQQLMRVGGEEQYRTTTIVSNLPRTITVSISNQLAQVYVDATNEAIARYNAQNLGLRFRRVGNGGNIVLLPSPSDASYLASAGFPSGGNPHNFVRINNTFLGNTTSATRINYIGSIIAHEIGHCIGFRHTDYTDRSFSCGGAVSNEGAGSIGAIQIPGTPAGADPNSWMLACIGNNVNRPFNANDIIALTALYPQ
jgi:hypothetical protein